ncbi:MAG: type II toxin-antitoxin system VapC family toxin [Oscillospiraceae bacterium]|nr:type II toxin-antitoxin system VapC family toxin [Oscillospiraceae bacterium]
MKYLLDTHVALWLFEGNKKLPQDIQNIIYDSENEIFLNIVSVWEVAIKISLNKLDFTGGSKVFLSAIKNNNIDLLGIKNDYINLIEKLEFIHRDPFDRMIIATALAENFTIITADENIQKYNVPWIW